MGQEGTSAPLGFTPLGFSTSKNVPTSRSGRWDERTDETVLPAVVETLSNVIVPTHIVAEQKASLRNG
jgi:hypothetical protein